ncbi:tetratricopeptide repeat protein [Algibacter sp. 2305UL17-15]|uniref:tetratricopeptide repeat protein n=1 Tax=Algibacter sp. 2305UL17-15 TaxID=3231268 RepID=UPI003457EBA2
MIRTVLVCLVMLVKAEAQTSVLTIADSLYLNGNYSKAIEHYKSYDNQSEVFDKIAKAYIAIGNYDAALKSYEASIKTNPNNSLIKYEYGKLLSKTKNYENASHIFKNLIEVDNLNPNYHYELGLVLEKLKDSMAQNKFYNAFKLDSTHQKAIYSLAKNHLIKGENKLADKYIDIGLSSYENNKELISLKAQNYFVRNLFDDAIVWFEKLIGLNESSQFIHEKLSLSYTKILEYEKAIFHAEKALKFDPENAKNLYILGQLYERIQDLAKAEEYISMSLKLQDYPLDDEYMNLGMILNKQEKHKEAIEAYNKAVKENPSSERAHFYVVFTKDQYYKDIETRIKLYEAFKKKFPKSDFLRMVDFRISALKKEKFIKQDEK